MLDFLALTEATASPTAEKYKQQGSGVKRGKHQVIHERLQCGWNRWTEPSVELAPSKPEPTLP